MGRNTIVDVREAIDRLNDQIDEHGEISFECWGTGQNRYRLMNRATGETYGSVCIGASEFLKTIRAFADGERLD